MNPLSFVLLCCFLIPVCTVKSQNIYLPDVDLYTLDGARISVSELRASDTLLVMYFWKTNSRQSFNELLKINELHWEWVNCKKVKVVGICTDVCGNPCDIKPLIFGYNIEFDVYIDKNNLFKRAMNIPDVPYLVIVGNNPENIRFMGSGFDIAEIISNKIHVHLAAMPECK